MGGRKFPPNITQMATWILSKSHKTCPAEEMSSTPNLLPGELLLSLGQNSFQTVNKKFDLLILASLYKQISSSEKWCGFQEETGHSLHAWDRLCLAALLPTEQVTKPFRCLPLQVSQCTVGGEKREFPEGVSGSVGTNCITAGQGNNLRVLGFQHSQREMVTEDGRGGVPVAKWPWLWRWQTSRETQPLFYQDPL